jgi:hypothetical protein
LKTIQNRLSQKPPVLRLLALVPHRDARLPLRSWSASLFTAGLPGARSFPQVTPLASLGRPLSGEELKFLARTLREHVNLCGGKFIAGPPAPAALPDFTNSDKTVSVFGPSLQIELPDDFFTPVEEAVVKRISPLVIGSALVQGINSKSLTQRRGDAEIANSDSATLRLCVRSFEKISFRAGALANMSFRPLLSGDEWDGYSAEWEIGKLFWLPKNIISCYDDHQGRKPSCN